MNEEGKKVKGEESENEKELGRNDVKIRRLMTRG